MITYECKVCGFKTKTLKRHLRKHKKDLNLYLSEYNEYDAYESFLVDIRIERKQNSPLNDEFWMVRGLTIEAAKKKVNETKIKTIEGARRKESIITNIEYWTRRNFTVAEAKIKIKIEKEKYSVTMESMIAKYGEVKGTEKYLSMITTRRKSLASTICEKYNTTDKKQAFSQWGKHRSDMSPVTKAGSTNELARVHLAKKFSPRCIEYWIKKTDTLFDAELQLSLYQDNISVDNYIRKFGKTRGFLKWKESNKITRFETFEEYIKSKEYYYRDVWRFTNFYYRLYKEMFGERNTKYHLDHKYSIHDGFKNNIDVILIGSPYNLNIISATENLTKQNKCSITVEELKETHNKNKLNLELIGEY